jgi:lipoprotein-anchoring transpeptidase ErfK/SrfK
MKIKISIAFILLVAVALLFFHQHHSDLAASKATKNPITKTVTATPIPASPQKNPITAQTAPPVSTECQSNAGSKEVIVSVAKQHMWGCEGKTVAYDSAVITGMLQYDDSTPLGTYQIYSKHTNQTLKGCDQTGCWNDPVSYWLPYQQASGGTIGFHDANWRQPTDFGNITPASNKGSHGCVEMPLAAAKWLYGWSAIGTSVTIET